VFAALVTSSLALILAANVAIRDRTSGFSEGAGTPRRAALERLHANPSKCAMTMRAGPDSERLMRHVNAGLIPGVDVLEVGQSDSDHMSQTFFRDDVRFHNGFISGGHYVQQYEVFDEITAVHGAPKLVLLDVRSGFLLIPGPEPLWDWPPPGDPMWWGSPLFHLGKGKPPPWYRDIPSLLSLAQTELTLSWFAHQLPQRRAAPASGDTESDTGAEFRCVAVTQKSNMYRWLDDGSRVYAGELGGVLAPQRPVQLSEAAGDRRINEARLVGLELIIQKILAAGTTIIMYSPPLHPVVFDDKKQAAIVRAADQRFKQLADKYALDYCDFADGAAALGCVDGDFYDEHHISRHCNQRIVRALALECAPRAGAKLKELLKPETLR